MGWAEREGFRGEVWAALGWAEREGFRGEVWAALGWAEREGSSREVWAALGNAGDWSCGRAETMRIIRLEDIRIWR